MAWACVTVGQSEVQLFIALAEIAERRIGDFTAQDLAFTAWAFVTVGQSDAKLFIALAKAAEQRISNFGMHELANTA